MWSFSKFLVLRYQPAPAIVELHTIICTICTIYIFTAILRANVGAQKNQQNWPSKC